MPLIQKNTALLLAPALLLAVLFAACKKDDADAASPGSTDSVTSYLPVKPGNYWIYESWRVDSNGSAAPGSYYGQAPVYDSVYAISDTMIDGRLFHRYCAPVGPGDKMYETWAVSDSGNYLIQPDHRIMLSLTDSSAVFYTRTLQQPAFSNDSAATLSYSLEGWRTQPTPAGSFQTLSMVYTWTFYPYAQTGVPVSQRRQFIRFAKGIGIVSQTAPIYVSMPYTVEQRLLRYHVQ